MMVTARVISPQKKINSVLKGGLLVSCRINIPKKLIGGPGKTGRKQPIIPTRIKMEPRKIYNQSIIITAPRGINEVII